MANEFKIRKGLIVEGALGGTVVNVLGSQGQLLSVTDNLSGSIFAVSDISGVPILDVNSSGLSTFDGNVTIGSISTNVNRSLTILADDSNEASINLYGNSQGTGLVYVGQSSSYGGGIVYNGDGSPAYGNSTTDTISFYRREAGTNSEVFRYGYGGAAVTFVGEITTTELNLPSGGMVDWANGDARIVEGLVNNYSLSFQTWDGTNVSTALRLDGDNNATFATQAFATTATSSGNGSSTLTTKGYVDGLITGATIYRGAWDPSGGGYGSPDLSGVTQTSGYYYICSAAGTAEPNGTGTEPDSWEVGDWVIYNDVSGTGQWQKIDNSSVLSGIGTGQTVALWEGAASVTDSETLGNAPITVSGNNVNFADSISVADSARFEGTTSPITIGDGFGYGGSATICKHNSVIYLQYNNGEATSTVNFGGGGTATTIYDAQNASYKLNSGTADSWVAGQGGQFGVGLTNPNTALHVQESSEDLVARFQHSGDGHEAALRFQTIDGTASRYTDIAQSATTGNLDIRAPYNATIPNLTIKNGGDIGINISDPQAQLHISTGAPAPNTNAVTSLGVGLVVSGNDGLMDLLSYDDNTTVATSIGMGRYNQTTGNIIDKWGLVTWYDTGSEGSNLSERITLHYGTNKLPWNSTGMVTVLRDGNVGIGTTNPTSPLTIKSNSTSSSSSGLTIQSSGNTNDIFQLGEKSTDGARLQMLDAGVVKIALYSDGSNNYINAGNVGIGTTSNSAEETNNGVPKFQVTTTTAVLGEFPLAARFTTGSDAGDNSGVSVLINSGNDRGLMISAGRAESNRTRANLNLVSFDGNELIDGITLYMPNTGSTGATTGTNVGIGTKTPNAKLDIQGTQGQLFSVTDDLSGEIFAVADISGVPIMAVNSSGVSYLDGKVFINASASIPNRTEEFQVTGRQIITNTGTNSAALYLGYNSSGSNTIQLGRGRTADGLSYIDLNGEVMSAGDYGFRIMRRAGVNAVTDLIQVGTGNLTINAANGADTVFTNTNVGIGTTSPLAGLDIANTNTSIYQQWSYDNPGANNYNLQLTETVTSGNVRFVFDQKNAGTQYSDVLVFNQGKIGMGTDEPDGQLNISKSTSGITPALTLTNNQYGAADNTGSSIRFQGYSLFNPGSSNPRYSEIIGVNGSGSVPKRIDFKFTADADVKTPLSVLQTGNVGIGTTSPDAKLEVAGGSTGIRLSNVGDSGAYDSIEMTYNGYNSGTPEMKFRPTQTPGSGNLNSYFRFINSNGNSTTANNRANITVDNQVGIGPTGIFTSNHILNLSGTGIAIKNDTNGSSNNWSQIKNTAAASGSNLVFLTATGTNIMDDTGRLGIGVTGPSYKLDVAGTIRATGDVIAYSDARVKDNVVTIGNALEKVTQLRGVSYTRNDVDDTTTKIGVIAQEVLEVLPEVVQEDDEGKYSVAYGNMVGLLIESIKELKAEVDELKSRL